jgi:isocitrate dehydrogenase
VNHAALHPSSLILQKPYDFARLMEGANEVKCSQFGDAVISKM